MGSEFKEEALFYRLKAAHDFVLKSYDRRKPERIKDAIEAYQKLKRNFPESKFMEDSDKMLVTLQEEDKRIKAIITEISAIEETTTK